MSGSGTGPFVEIAIVRVLSAGGPYEPDELVSVAFTSPDIGRLRGHEANAWERAAASNRIAGDGGNPRVPDVISALVLSPAGPYRRDEIIDLAFVDPSLARIHRPHLAVPVQIRTSSGALAAGGAQGETAPRHAPIDRSTATAEASTAELADAPASPQLEDEAETLGVSPVHHRREMPLEPTPPPAAGGGVSLHLRWSPDRVRRFVQVCDKLFTVERLGWYRHALVLRLLVPDAVRCDDTGAELEASQHLASLRHAVAESLGNPLLAAFMPNFSVTTEWLESIDTVEIARALAAFRGAIAPHAGVEPIPPPAAFRSGEETVASLTRQELLATPVSSIEAGLALLVPHAAAAASLADPLGAYRAKLTELFGQMADTPEKARLRTMTQTNHALDDLLWQLVAGVQQTFEPAPAA